LSTSDFRATLYNIYRSRFKTEETTQDERFWSIYENYCRRRFVKRLEAVDRGLPVLEIGCGQGAILRLLRSEGFTHAEGIDAAIEQVEAARRTALPVLHGDIFDHLRGRKDYYAAIIAIDVFEHFSKEELMDLVSLIREALRPGGLLLFQTPNGEGLFARRIIYGDLTHMTILTKSSATQLLAFAGLEAVAFYETSPLVVSVGSAIRAALWACVRLLANAIRWVEIRKLNDLWTENMITVARKSGERT